MGPVGSRGRPRKLEHFADIVLQILTAETIKI